MLLWDLRRSRGIEWKGEIPFHIANAHSQREAAMAVVFSSLF
jgi:hypothetical protein